MSESASKAVFLSYASQDAAAVQRIAEALRATGVEVWFDKNELVGGDAWDQKIRRQIKECAIFVPVISASTNARAEGYFRLEWKLAVDRSHLMADDAPFLFPVVIDETADAAARVPDKFRDVQWTRLNVKDTPASLAARVARLLSGVAAGPVADRPPGHRPGLPPSQAPGHKAWTWFGYAWGIVGVAIGLIFAFRNAWSPRVREPKPAAVTSAPAPAPKIAALSEARQLADRGFGMSVDNYDSTLDDFTTAEALIKRAVTLDPNDGEIWARSAQLNLMFRNRGFDFSPGRIAAGREQAERAIRLVPDAAESLYAMSLAHRYTGNQAAQLEMLQRVVAIDPDHARGLLALGSVLIPRGQEKEGFALFDRARKQPKWAPLADYFEFLRLFNRGQFADADRLVRRAFAAKPSANSISGIAMVHLTWKGDLDEAAGELAAVPPAFLTAPRVVWSTAQVQLSRRAPDAALKALDRLPDDFIQDSWFTGPKAGLVGRAQALAGRETAARLAFEAGLAVIDTRIKTTPNDPAFHCSRGLLLACLGRADEALVEARTVAEINRGPAPLWNVSEVTIYAALGRADLALPLIDALMTAPGNWPLTSTLLRLDPLWDKLRDDPRFLKLCAALPEEKRSGLAAARVLSEGAQLAARALVIYAKVGFTRDDLATAEDFARRATEKEPDLAAAWGARAGVQSAWLLRGWDNSEKRRQDAQSNANRALALDPTDPEALLALGLVLRNQGAQDQAVAQLRRALAFHPDHVRLGRALGYTLSQRGQEFEGRPVLLEILKRAPGDPLLRYDLALSYASYGRGGANPENLAAALEHLDAAIAIQPFSTALVLKAALLGGWRGDLPAMRAVLDQQDKLSLGERSEDRAVCIGMWAGLLEHRPDRVEAAAGLTARNYFDDTVMPFRPKAWSLAMAHQLAGKENLAHADWSAAEGVMRQRLKDEPGNATYQAELAITLAWLGQRDEAARLIASVEPLWREASTITSARLLALYYAAIGDAVHAAPYLAQEIDQSAFTTRKSLPLDPGWQKIRSAPEFTSLLKASEPGK